jgi:threonine synthase
VAVQAEGCAPVIRAFEQELPFCDYWVGAHTIASGLRVPKSFADQVVLRDLRASRGNAVAVSDERIGIAQRQLAALEGIFAAPEGAAALAGLIKLVKQSWIHPEERVVLFNTGTGLKYLKSNCA